MRAVNLIPSEQRRGAGGIAGRSGGVVYVLTGGLAVLVLLGAVYALAVHDVAKKKGQLAAVTQQATTVAEQTQALAPYVQFAAASAQKVSEVKTLASSRFNWPGAMRQLALGLPGDVTLTSFQANTGTAAGTTLSLTGCASKQDEVATVLTSLAAVPGVATVTLTNASKGATATSGRSKLAVGGACPFVGFALTLTYDSGYTVPYAKPAHSTGSAQTVSTPTAPTTIKTAGAQQSTGVTP